MKYLRAKWGYLLFAILYGLSIIYFWGPSPRNFYIVIIMLVVSNVISSMVIFERNELVKFVWQEGLKREEIYIGALENAAQELSYPTLGNDAGKIYLDLASDLRRVFKEAKSISFPF